MMIRVKISAILLFALIMLLAPAAFPAQVILKSGKVYEGEIIEQTPEAVTIKDADGIEIPIPMDKVERIAPDAGGEKPVSGALPELVIQNGHTDSVTSVAFSPDGKTLASGSADHTIRLWSVETGELIRELKGHSDFVNSVAFSPDGKMLASGSRDGTIRLWSVETWELICELKGHAGVVFSVAFSPDGGQLASGSEDQIIRMWSVETGELICELKGHAGMVYSVAFSPDGKTLASGSMDGTIRLWSVETGEMVRELNAGWVMSVSFSPDGKTLASGSADHTIRLWSVETGELVRELKEYSGGGLSVAFSPDGKTLASGSGDQTIRLWSVDSGALVRELKGHSGKVESVAFSPDGKTLASGNGYTTIQLWSVETGDLVRELIGHSLRVGSVTFSPDGKTLASGSTDHTIRLWSFETGELIHELKGHSDFVNFVAFSPDGKTLASVSADRTIRLWSVETGELVRELKGHSDEVISVAFSPDGKTLASGSKDQTIRLWSVETEEMIRELKGHSSSVSSVTFSPDGKTLAWGSWDCTIRLWSVETGELVRELKGHSSSVRSVAFSPDGKALASGSFFATIRLWNVESGEFVRELKGCPNWVSSSSLSLDEKTLASGSIDAILLQLDAGFEEYNREMLEMIEHRSDIIGSVTFSPDGKTLASGSGNGTIRLWSVETGELVRELKGHSDWVYSIAFSPDGKTIASGSADTTIKLWNAQTGENLATLIAFNDGNWFVSDSSGRFDCSGCARGEKEGGMKYIRWRVGNELFAPEQFFDMFFEPGLLADVVKLGHVPERTDLSRVLAQMPPKVEMTPLYCQWDKNLRIWKIKSDEVRVQVTVRDNGGGMENVRLLAWGRPTGEGIETTPKDSPAGTRTFEFTVSLAPGDNRLEALASSRSGVDSRAAEAKIRAEYESGPVKLFILTVGINQYKNRSYDLKWSVADADAFADAVKSGGKDVLYQAPEDIRLRDQEATRDNIREALERIKAQAGTNDMVIVFFSGHGVTAGGGWFFITHEVTSSEEGYVRENGFSERELKAFLKGLKARKVVVVLDACQSGAMALAMAKGLERDKVLRELARSTGTYMIAASTDAQYALEDSGLGHGVLTHFVLEAMEGKGDGNGSGTVEAGELVDYAGANVPEYTEKKFGYRQDPFLWGVSGGGGIGGKGFPVVKLP